MSMEQQSGPWSGVARGTLADVTNQPPTLTVLQADGTEHRIHCSPDVLEPAAHQMRQPVVAFFKFAGDGCKELIRCEFHQPQPIVSMDVTIQATVTRWAETLRLLGQ